MTATSSSRGRITEPQIPKKWTDRETSPERTRVWTEPKPKFDRKVSVVYYLSSNGQLEHPHLMEVPLSSPQGLFLRDVINRLNLLRGKGMATLYSWSAKRSYKNGFCWHDLSENDFIYPTQGHEYILKGSGILHHTPNPRPSQTASSRSLRPPEETRKSEDDSEVPVITSRRNQSWSSIDLQEYRVYKSESSGDSTGKIAADASTQTDDKRRRRRAITEEKAIEVEGMEGERIPQVIHNLSTELSREEISPPPSDSSPETLETLMEADRRLALYPSGAAKENPTADKYPSGRMRASSVLLQLLSCGSMSFKECGATSIKDQGFSLVEHYKSRLARGAGNQVGTSMAITDVGGVKLEDREYFSGSFIETNEAEVAALKRSSSDNADGSSELQIIEHEEDGVRAKCTPRKSRTLTKTEAGASKTIDSSGQQGSQRFDVQL